MGREKIPQLQISQRRAERGEHRTWYWPFWHQTFRGRVHAKFGERVASRSVFRWPTFVRIGTRSLSCLFGAMWKYSRSHDLLFGSVSYAVLTWQDVRTRIMFSRSGLSSCSVQAMRVCMFYSSPISSRRLALFVQPNISYLLHLTPCGSSPKLGPFSMPRLRGASSVQLTMHPSRDPATLPPSATLARPRGPWTHDQITLLHMDLTFPSITMPRSR